MGRDGSGPTPRSLNDSATGFGPTPRGSWAWRAMYLAPCRGAATIQRNGFGPTPLGSRTWRGMDLAPCRGASTIQRNGFGPTPRGSRTWRRMDLAQCRGASTIQRDGFGPTPLQGGCFSKQASLADLFGGVPELKFRPPEFARGYVVAVAAPICE